MATDPWHVVLCVTTYTNLKMTFVVWQFPPNLVPQLGCYEAWMNRISVYFLCFRLVGPCSCSHKTCGMLGNIPMANDIPFNIMLNPEYGLVVLQFSPNLVPQLRCSELCRTGSWCIDYAPGFSYLAHTQTKHMEWLLSHLWHVILHVTIYTNLRMAYVCRQFSPNLVPQLGCYEAWMSRILVY